MDFVGEVVFLIADSKSIDTNINLGFLPSKIIKKGDLVALGKKASKNRLLYVLKFSGKNDFLQKLENLLSLLSKKKDYVKQLMSEYEEISIDIYIRSDFAEISFNLPLNIIQKIALIECPVNFEILSFGMADNR